MKKILAFCLVCFGFTAAAQDINLLKSGLKYDAIWRDANAWFSCYMKIEPDNELIKQLPKKEGIYLHIPNDYQIVRPNGNRYMQVYLFNFTSDTIIVPRLDATIGNINTEAKKNGKWEQLQTTFGARCGNSDWKMKMDPHTFIAFELENYYICSGEHKLDFKIMLKTKEYTAESNIVKIRLLKEQYARLENPINLE